MADFSKVKVSAAVKPEEKKAEAAGKLPPQAYIFIGRDSWGNDLEPQEMRQLFMVLARMARKDDGTEFGQNEFGLSIVVPALLEIREAFQEGLGDKFDEVFAHHWQNILDEEAKKATLKAEREAAAAAEAAKLEEKHDIEEALTRSVAQPKKK